ncbi:small ribosomal subunit protein uS9m-like [Physella acuta]|uniref:small ribosomal subunit protein uS9m-like n=1 Tax=Physella acuta TaxID=109671 RepID=UPI0027DE8E87|nr:small ribosomal subunit protein uS9m-like [Physella acuta]
MASISPCLTSRILLRKSQFRIKHLTPCLQYVKHPQSDSGNHCELSTAPTNVPPIKVEDKPTSKAITISRAMKAYMEQTKAHDQMMKAQVSDYELGKRHLANIMGKDPDNFTQTDVERAIEYLLPSGIFDKKARPLLKDPYEIFPKKKVAQFSLDGRPYHWLYFTTLPNYYNILYDIAWKIENLKLEEDELYRKKETISNTLNLAGSDWITFQQLKDKLVENIRETDYQHFIKVMERLISHPLSYKEEAYIMQYRVMHKSESSVIQKPQIEQDEDGRYFACAEGTRKDAWAHVKLYKPGTGKVIINDKDLAYFENFLYRESILNPLTALDLIGQVDIVAETKYGGPAGQAGAIRYGIAKALCAFINAEEIEKLRLSGMLTRDPREKERKKPGQEKARKKFTWKKR